MFECDESVVELGNPQTQTIEEMGVVEVTDSEDGDSMGTFSTMTAEIQAPSPSPVRSPSRERSVSQTPDQDFFLNRTKHSIGNRTSISITKQKLTFLIRT